MAKHHFTTLQHENLLELKVEGDIHIKHTNKFKNFLLESFKRSGDERLNLTKVNEFDCTSAQLLFLWKNQMNQQGRQATIELPENKNLKDLLDKTGITKIIN